MNLFQGQNLLEFADRFKSDEDCMEYLGHFKWEDGLVCTKCGHTGCQSRKNHSRTCNKCSHTESATANPRYRANPLRGATANGKKYTTTAEYTYDKNGNLTTDLNKNILSITYNTLNLPVSVNKTTGNRVEYIYDAAGNKLRQLYYVSGTLTKTTDFVGNFVYENNVPAYVVYPEGRVVLNSTGTTYCNEAYIKDHLGNVRVACYYVPPGIKIRQINSYYPFGMNIKELSANSTDTYKPNKYLYNGKMMQDEMGLGWLDYGARFYDAILGRWHSVDMLVEKYRRWSPYNYCMDNPMRFIDPDGMGPWDIVKGAALITGGAVQWVGGVAAVSSGVGAPLGVALIMSGSATIGFGTAVLVNNGKENIPTGMGQALGRGYDLSTKNGSHTGEKVGAGLDFVAGIPTGPVNAVLSKTSVLTTGISAISTGETISNLSTSTEPQKVEANNTETGSDKNAKNTPVKENTKTQHSQTPNPFAPQPKKEENPVQDWGTHK